MSYNTQSLIRDAQGVPVPQYYDANADAFVALEGRDGAFKTILYVIQDIVTASTDTTKTYATPMQSILISNDGAEVITLTVGTLVLPVAPYEVFDEYFPNFTTFTITASTPFRAIVRG